MRAVFAFILLLAVGCGGGGGVVSEDEFNALASREQAERLLGPPDAVKEGWLIWEDRVQGPAGLTRGRAALRVDGSTGKVTNRGVLYRD